MKKARLVTAALVAMMTISVIPVYAAEWKQDEKGYWYQNDDGSYPKDCWQEIGGKQYYFGSDGYMFANTTTPDGKQVGADGALVAAPLFDFDIEDSHIVYSKYRITKDYDGNKCVVLYYDFTNKKSDPQGAWLADYSIKVFQNGVECDTAYIWDGRDDAMDNYSKDVMQGTTINVAKAYKVQDNSDLTIQIKELWKWSNPKTQTVTLKIQ